MAKVKKSTDPAELFPGGKGATSASPARSQETAGKVDTSGFECTPEDSIEVTFRVLLPYRVWGFTEQTKLGIFFGHPKLGDWRACVDDFTSRDVGGGLWEMSATICIQATLLKDASSIPYKYGVLNYSSDNIKSHFEFLYGAPGSGKPVNRCLIIPTSLFLSGGTYNQFDTMVYPEFKSSVCFSRMTDWLSGSSTSIPDSESMRQKCLMTYLDGVRDDLIHCFPTHACSVDQVVNNAIQIVTSLVTQRILHPHTGDRKVWKDSRLVSPFMLKEWLFPIVDIVRDHPVNTAEESGKKVMAGIIIICIIGKLLETKLLTLSDIHPRCAANMLQTLCLHPDLENEKCLDYEFVRSVIPDHYVKDCTGAISKLGDYLMVNADIESAEWLYCLPILHFLNNDVKPFDAFDLHVPVEKLVFTDHHLKLELIAKRVADKEGFFASYFEKLKPLLYTDPLLQCALTYICPRKDRSLLIRNVSPYLCIAIMIKKQQEKDKSELDYWSSALALQHIEDITVTLKTSPSNFNPSYMLDAAIRLLFVCIKVTCSKTEHYLKVYKAIVLLIFSAALQLGAADSRGLKIVNDNVARIQQCFSDWISDMSIIGLDMFGGSWNAVHQRSAVEELKIWVSLFDAECPVEFTQQWHGVVKNIVESRVNKLNPENRIDLLCVLESCEGTPDLLVNVITVAAIAALDSINEQNLERFCSETAGVQHVFTVLSSLLKKKYVNVEIGQCDETEKKSGREENLSQRYKKECDETLSRELHQTRMELQQAMKQHNLATKKLAETEEKLSKLSNQYNAECVQIRKELQQTITQRDNKQKECNEAQRELEDLRDEHSKCRTVWIVPRHQVTVLDTTLGGGAWGYVKKGRFKEQQVAVKCIHESIITQDTIRRVYREICTMAQVHHPNLVQFIAAVLDDQGGPMIITELLNTTLRKAYEDSFLKPGLNQCVAILGEVASALSYLHELEAPIIHRDVSSANVLLKAMPQDKWKAKLSDFGSANWAKQASTMGEGAIVYTAPEAYPLHPSCRHTPPPPQTTKIDVYSYGILLCEITLRKFPDPDRLSESKKELKAKHVRLHSLMVRCTHDDPAQRPSMADVLKDLDDISRK